VEIDRDLAQALRGKYEGRSDVSIVEGDVLETDLDVLAGGPFMLVGNVPYNITTPIIFHALASVGLRRAVFLLQREVADRLQAAPATREYGALTVNVGLTCAVERIASVPAGAFFPRPTVQSAVVRLQPLAMPHVTTAKADAVRAFVTAMFGQRRRQLVRALRTVAGLAAPEAASAVQRAALDPLQRPEELSAGEFVRLYEASRSA
jgi:16S rRNA (adenine1518-N6/adenine1519-N6)-dimethyltransferase